VSEVKKLKPIKKCKLHHYAECVMTPDFVDLSIDFTVKQALQRVREVGKYSMSFVNCYVVDKDGKLIGKVSIRRLVLANPEDKLENIYDKKVIFVEPCTKNSELVKIMRERRLPSLPVVDDAENRRLVGIVTIDKVADILEHDATHEMQGAAGVSNVSDQPYLKTSIWKHTATRMPWLIFLLFAAMLAGLLVSFYEESFKSMPILVTFIPMIMAIAGAGGSQVSTVTIRSMAVGEITTKQYLKAFIKEFWISIVCGVLLGLVNFLFVMIWYRDLMLGVVLWLGLIATVIFAKLLGMLLPILAKKCRIDPALISSPLVTIIADIFGIFVYFTFATMLLGV